jgi:hypothetical protein
MGRKKIITHTKAWELATSRLEILADVKEGEFVYAVIGVAKLLKNQSEPDSHQLCGIFKDVDKAISYAEKKNLQFNKLDSGSYCYVIEIKLDDWDPWTL